MLLLGRDWIHANWCVSSSLHQFLLFWKGDEVKVVWEKFKGKKKNGTPREIYMELRDTSKIQDQAFKLLKTTSIMPFRLIKGLIIKEIDD